MEDFPDELPEDEPEWLRKQSQPSRETEARQQEKKDDREEEKEETVVADRPAARPQSDRQTDDYAAQARELLAQYPKLRGKELPEEVLRACAQRGVSMLEAYRSYHTSQVDAENRRLQQELQLLRHNSRNRRRAPVKGVSGGASPHSKGEDDFLKGFNSDF